MMVRLLTIVPLLSAFLYPSAVQAQSDSAIELVQARAIVLGDLMRSLASRDHGTVQFRETRYFSKLKDPVVLTGTLSFEKPLRLTKIVERPRWERIDVVDDEVSIRTSEGQVPRTLRLSDTPSLNGLIVALRATLSGNEAQLVELFALHISGVQSDWHLDLLPRGGAIRDKIIQISVTGRGGEPTSFLIVLRTGDRTLIEILG